MKEFIARKEDNTNCELFVRCQKWLNEISKIRNCVKKSFKYFLATKG